MRLEVTQGPSPGEALIDAVPEADLLLADVPAQQDVLPFTAGREVEQSAVEVLHEHAGGLDPFDHACECAGRLLQVRVRLCEVGGRQIPAVSRDPPPAPPPPPGNGAEVLPPPFPATGPPSPPRSICAWTRSRRRSTISSASG